MNRETLIALDRSARRIDADGRLHVDRSHISKATVNPYYGKEIPGFDALGLDPDKAYRLLRDPVELERGAPTFARLPILSKHVQVTVDAPRPDLVVGAIGSEVTFNAPYLDADLCIWDAKAIAGIETDKVRELSCAYRYVPVMEAGEYEGQPYDGRMTQIAGNHLALVEVGRAGSDVVVADHNPFVSHKEPPAMKKTKLGQALIAVLCAASPVLAADSALPGLVGAANRKTFNKQEVKAKLIAMDAELDPQQLDNVIDALLDVEQNPAPMATPAAAADEPTGAVEKLRQLLAGKVDEETLNAACALVGSPAVDAEPEGMKPEEVKAAMDAYGAELRKQLLAAEEARREVRPVVGEVLGMDSASDIYGFALDHMKVDRKDIEGEAALRAIFRASLSGRASVAPATPQIAADSAAKLTEQFPGAARFLTA